MTRSIIAAIGGYTQTLHGELIFFLYNTVDAPSIEGNSMWSEHFSSDLKGSGIKVTLKVKNKNKKYNKLRFQTKIQLNLLTYHCLLRA